MQILKRLYPNFLKKIDRELLMTYPHLWRTRIHDFGWFSLILGNILAVVLGTLLVSKSSFPTSGTLYLIYGSSILSLGFIILFWALKVRNFKIRQVTYKDMLFSWLAVCACLVSLGFNVTVLLSTINYHTAYLYEDKVLQADYEYLSNYDNYSYKEEYNDNVYQMGKVSDHYMTPRLIDIMNRHSYVQKSKNPVIYKKDVMQVIRRVDRVKDAKVFVWSPILGKAYEDYSNRSELHSLFRFHWMLISIFMLFTPIFFFLISNYGFQRALVSSIIGIICFLITISSLEVLYDIFELRNIYSTRHDTIFNIFNVGLLSVAAMIGLVLILWKNMRFWGQFAGALMLFLPVVFLILFEVEDEVITHIPWMLLFVPLLTFMAYRMQNKANQPLKA